MSPDYHLEPKSGQEIGHPIGAKHVRHVPANVFAPTLNRDRSRIGPQQIAQHAAPGHRGGPSDPVDLSHVLQIGAEASVSAENEAADNRCNRHAVERPVERSPQPSAREQAVSGPALMIETVPDIHGTALVVPSEQVNVFRISNLESQQ